MNKEPEKVPEKASTPAQGPLKYTKYGMIFGLVVVVTGVIMTILYGYRPAPTQVMKPSFFDGADQIGVVALKRFYAQLATEKVVILGIPTTRDWSTQFVTGFLIAAQQNSRAFSHVIAEAQLASETRDEVRKMVPKLTEINTNTETVAELTDAVLAAKKTDERILILLPNVYSSHLLAGNVMNRLEANLLPAADKGRIFSLFSITVGLLALEPAQEKELDPVCTGSERDGAGTANLGCAMVNAGRFFYRKRILEKEPNARSRFVAMMQSSRPNDYLLLVREPQNYGKKP